MSTVTVFNRRVEDVRNDYTMFENMVIKQEHTKTTDECYTPQDVYDAVLAWATANCPEWPENAQVIRPFWPGMDYQTYEYPENCVVCDNIPFSKSKEILQWYTDAGIRYFLFVPTLTSIYACSLPSCCLVLADGRIRYENRACINTSFATNMIPGVALKTAPELHEAIKHIQKIKKRAVRYDCYVYPEDIATVKDLTAFVRHNVPIELPKTDVYYKHRAGYTSNPYLKQPHPFGGMLLLSERAKEYLSEKRTLMQKNPIETRIMLGEKETRIIEEMNRDNAEHNRPKLQ